MAARTRAALLLLLCASATLASDDGQCTAPPPAPAAAAPAASILNTTVFMAEMSWYEYAKRVAAGVTVILPVGSTEQHGPHLPLSVDVVIPTGVARLVAERVGALVAPTIAYGYKSVPCMGGGPFIGSVGMDAAVVVEQVRGVVRELVRHGVRRIVLLDGHMENQMPMVEAASLATRDAVAAGVSNLETIRLEYWDFVQPSTTARVFPDGFPGAALEHAAVQETSLMLALRPDLVDLSLMPGAGAYPADRPAAFPPYTFEPPESRPEWAPFSGVLSPANAASIEKGTWLLADHVDGIVGALRAEWGADPLAGLLSA